MNTTALTIAQQLGGNKFTAMTGAQLVTFDSGLHIQLPRCAKGINSVVIRLDKSDTYTVQFNKRSRDRITITQVASMHNVYAEQLRRVFTLHTGLATSL